VSAIDVSPSYCIGSPLTLPIYTWRYLLTCTDDVSTRAGALSILVAECQSHSILIMTARRRHYVLDI